MAVAFSKPAAKRIAAAVLEVESMAGEGGRGAGLHRGGYAIMLCKTTATWAKGADATLTVYNKKTRVATTRTAKAFNPFVEVKANKWVVIMGGLLIAAECG